MLSTVDSECEERTVLSLPATAYGRLSLLGPLVLAGALFLLWIADSTFGASEAWPLFVTILMGLIVAGGFSVAIGAGVAAGYSVVRLGERSGLLLAPAAVALFAVGYGLGQVLGPS